MRGVSKRRVLRFQKEGRKVSQVVWIEAEIFSKVCEVSAKTGLAPNQVIAEAVKKYFLGGEPIVKEEVVKTERVLFVVCPFCLEEFKGANELRAHLPNCPQLPEELRRRE